ncbi:MAG: GerMN domain-containing protein [Oscillospiraceae bacterium]
MPDAAAYQLRRRQGANARLSDLRSVRHPRQRCHLRRHHGLVRAKSLTVDQQAQAALEQLLGGCTEPGYRSPIPQGVQLRSCQLTGGMALVDFSQGYEQLSGIDLTMADYCVTLTLSQLPGVSVVRITVEGQELAYRSHSLLRSQDLLMTSEDDVSRTLAIRLYFPAQSTGQLTPESRTLTLHEGDSSAEAIVSALLAGPQADGLSPCCRTASRC